MPSESFQKDVENETKTLSSDEAMARRTVNENEFVLLIKMLETVMVRFVLLCLTYGDVFLLAHVHCFFNTNYMRQFCSVVVVTFENRTTETTRRLTFL